MDRLFINLLFIGSIGISVAATSQELWTLKDKDNNTLFMANTSLQLHVTYITTTNETAEKVLNISQNGDDPFTISAGESPNNTFLNIWIENKKKTINVSMTFVTDTEGYYLSALDVMFELNNVTFDNSSTSANVSASLMNGEMLFHTPANMSYRCHLASEVELNSTEKQLTWLNIGEFVQLQAFVNTKDFANASSCFADQKQTAVKGLWNFDQNKTVCARLQTMATVEVSYRQLSGNMRNTTIPLPVNGYTSGVCNVTSVSGKVQLDGDEVFLSLTFEKIINKNTTDMYQLSDIALSYMTSSKFFPNHPKADNFIIISNSSLALNPVQVNTSYQCTIHEEVSVATRLRIQLTDTQWQAFNVPSKSFSKANKCPAMISTTTAPITTPAPEPINPPTYFWKANDAKNDTCFMAMAGIQLRASYMKEKSNISTDAWFDFTNSSQISSSECSNDSQIVTLENMERNQTITFVFSKMNSYFALTKVEVQFAVLDTTFENATGLDKMVHVSSVDKLLLLQTPLNHTYNCKMETQIALMGNLTETGISDIYLRITNISDLQAFATAGLYENASTKCFHDQTKPMATRGDWRAMKNKSDTCARLETVMQLNVEYYDISLKLQQAMIAVQGKNVTVLNSTCGENTTAMTLDIFEDKSINLTLTYERVSDTSVYSGADSYSYVLNNVTLSYKTTNPYFQNHKGYPNNVEIVPKSNLGLFETPVGSSFSCSASQMEEVTNSSTGIGLSVIFKGGTQWEAFGISKSGNFSKALVCPADYTTIPGTTTQPVTPSPDLPDDPTPEHFIVYDQSNNKTVCFLADIGVQLRTSYYTANDNSTIGTAIGFNFLANDTSINATCTGNMSEVVFYRKDAQQKITMMFTLNDKNESSLKEISVEYNITAKYFPNPNKTETKMPKKFSIHDVNQFKTSKDQYYMCSEETDILLDHNTNVILRVLGVKLQAFGISGKNYSRNKSQCFVDSMKTEVGKVGDWKVMKNKTVCARYQFTSVVNITYPTILGKMANTTFFFDNSTTKFGGECLGGDSSLFFTIDDNTFMLIFNKSNVKNDNFDYEMIDFNVQYHTKSKYFPNHAYVADGDEYLGNNSISVFSSSKNHAYSCAAEATIKLNETSSVIFKKVKVEPFGIAASGDFSAADDCAADQDLSPIIPIIVGSVLVVLVILVLIAYAIGRKRARNIDYETI